MKFRKYFARAAGALALTLAGGCADTQAPEYAAAEPEAAPGPALWKVGDEDTTIYLFGTVHALPADADWYDARIERAFTTSSELVTEIDMGDAVSSAQLIAGYAALEGDRTLRDLMDQEDRAEYEAALERLGLPAAALDRVEPWFAAMNLSLLPLVQSGYDPNSGVDMVLESRADTKERRALETIEEQIALFDTLPMDAQLAYLDETVSAVPTASSTLDAMVAEWLEGDADQLAALMNEDMDDPELYQRLLIDRNANWADWIEQRLEQPGDVFIAVGAGHLAGTGSVQDQLAERGIAVTRVIR